MRELEGEPRGEAFRPEHQQPVPPPADSAPPLGGATAQAATQPPSAPPHPTQPPTPPTGGFGPRPHATVVRLNTAQYWGYVEMPPPHKQAMFEHSCQALHAAASRHATAQLGFLRDLQLCAMGWQPPPMADQHEQRAR